MKAVQGYLSEDGRFFDTEEEADHHDSRESLLNALAANTVTDIASDTFLSVINDIHLPVYRYLQAVYNLADRKQTDAQAKDEANRPAPFTNLEIDIKDDGRAEEDTESVLEQSSGGHGGLPDVGGGAQSEEIQDRKAVDGSGGGVDDARRVRSGPFMAIRTTAKGKGTRAV